MVLRYKRKAYGRPFARSNKRKFTPYRSRRKVGAGFRGKRKFVRNVALSLAEPKNKGSTQTLGAVYHNTPVRIHLHDGGSASADSIAIGSANAQRNGTEVYSTGFSVRGAFKIPYDRRNAIFKIFLVEYNTAQGDPVTNLFYGTSGNTMLDSINNERFPGTKLLRTLRLTSSDREDASTDSTLYYNLWVPFKRRLRYSPTDIPYAGAKDNLVLLFVGYDTKSSTSLDAVASDHEQTTMFYYKDP